MNNTLNDDLFPLSLLLISLQAYEMPYESFYRISLSRVGTVTGWSTMYADGPQSMVLQKADVM